MAKQIDLAAQNAVAVRTESVKEGSANGKSAPSVFEAWTLHQRAVNDKKGVVPGAKLGSTTLRKQANRWVATVGGARSGRLGEVARLLASVR